MSGLGTYVTLFALQTLLLVVFGYGTASVMNGAAAMSLLPRLVERQHLQPAHARIDGADGVRWAYRGSGLRTLAIWTHAWFVGHAIVGVVLAPYVLRTLDLTAFQFGMIGAAGGVGAFLGATVTTWVGRRIGTGRTIIACHLITTLGVMAMVLAGQEMAPAGTVAVIVVGQSLYGLAMG